MMDTFNVVWCTLWGDYVMAQYQQDMDRKFFVVIEKNASDFHFFLSNILQKDVRGRFTDQEKDVVAYVLTEEEIESVTSWIHEFNQMYRKPSGFMLPDYYLDEENIRDSTIEIYSKSFTDMLSYMLEIQHEGRDKVAEWAIQNIYALYMNAGVMAKTAAVQSGSYKPEY